MSNTPKLTAGSIPGHLLAMALPMLGGIFAMMAFNAVDTLFVGQLGGRELAAMSFTFPVVMVVTAAAIGTSAGTSSVIARAVGANDDARTRRLCTDALLLAAVVSGTLSLVGIVTIDPVFTLLGAPADMLPLIQRYMTLWFLSAVLYVVPMVGMGAIRATGDTRVPMYIMIGAAVLNGVIDPLLIFGIGPFPRLDLMGAALALVIARVMMFVITLYVLGARLHMIEFKFPAAQTLFASWRAILHVGLPAAGTNMIIPLCTAVVTAMLASYGADVVAGFGVASRIEALSLIAFYALSAVIGPVLGQNFAAGKISRMLEAVNVSAVFCFAFGLLLTILMWLFGEALAGLFNDASAIIDVAKTFLYLVPLSYGAAGMVMTANAAFNGIGSPLPAVIISTARMAFIYLPLAWLGGQWFGYAGIFGAYAIANVVCGVGGYAWIRRRVNKLAV
ncbi:MAG: MATE family efflux transporter [Pseudomonadota bacterium]